jgi:hypothetical protein
VGEFRDSADQACAVDVDNIPSDEMFGMGNVRSPNLL